MEIKKTVESLPTVETVQDENDDDVEIAPIDHGTPADTNNAPVAIATTAVTLGNANQIDVQVLHKMKHLGGWFNQTALKYIACSQKNKNLETIDEEVNEDNAPEDVTASRAGREVANATLLHAVSKFAFYSTAKVIKKQAAKNGEDHHFVEPKTFCKAYSHTDPIQCEKWCTAIHKEFHDMTNCGVWHKVLKWSQVPAGWHCIKCKWVLKVKRDGVFHARLVACSYSQIPGLDFSKKHAPVINDVAWQILLIAKLVCNLEAILINIDTEFLYGDLEEEIHMDIPEGLTGFSDKCLLLLKALYGLVQGS